MTTIKPKLVFKAVSNYDVETIPTRIYVRGRDRLMYVVNGEIIAHGLSFLEEVTVPKGATLCVYRYEV